MKKLSVFDIAPDSLVELKLKIFFIVNLIEIELIMEMNRWHYCMSEFRLFWDKGETLWSKKFS